MEFEGFGAVPQSAVANISAVRKSERWRRGLALWLTVVETYHYQKGITVNKHWWFCFLGGFIR